MVTLKIVMKASWNLKQNESFHLLNVLGLCRKVAYQNHRISLTTLSCASSSSYSLQGAPVYSRQNLNFLLQSCILKNNWTNLHKIHGRVTVNGLASDTFLTNMLLNGYSKSGLVDEARKLLEGMNQRNLISWSTVISMYAQHDHGEEAFRLYLDFRRMSSESPNEFILASVMCACIQMSTVEYGTMVHGFAVKAGFDSDVYVGTSLVNFYSKMGWMESSELLFEKLPVRNSVTWTTIIVGYSQIGKCNTSLELFKQMLETGLQPDRFVLSSVANACALISFLDGGRQIHSFMYRNGVELDMSLNNVLIDFYSKCSKVGTARRLFDIMDTKNLVSWTTMIAGYMQNSRDFEAIDLFTEMSQLGWLPDAFACTSVMNSCGSLMALQQGKQVHAYVVKANLEDDEYVKNSLIDMYSKCNSMADARSSLNIMLEQNTVAYNAMIEGYANQNDLAESVKLFNILRSKSLSPNWLTFVGLLGASASKGVVCLSMQIHGLLIKYGVSLDLYSGSALVDVYSKCLFVDEARTIFEEMENRDLVVWNTMFFGYTQNDENEKAFRLYNELCFTAMKPDEFTFVALITATSNLASLFHGWQFHCQIIKTGVDSGPHVSNALIDMYAKCGVIREARLLFDTTCGRDTVCWNSMISRYAEHGHAAEALEIYKQMRKEKIAPNHVTFLGVLSACSHAGLVDDGFFHFNSMMSDFELEPGMEHYACVVGLLGRAGKLHEAKEFIEQMPIEPSAIIWRTFLGACRLYGNVLLGKYAAKEAITLEPRDSSSYIMLSNMFAFKEMWYDVENVRNKMDCLGVLKEPGYSWIIVKREVHIFTSRDVGHKEVDIIYPVLNMLTQLIKDIGCDSDITHAHSFCV